jgi:hypothetical protein
VTKPKNPAPEPEEDDQPDIEDTDPEQGNRTHEEGVEEELERRRAAEPPGIPTDSRLQTGTREQGEMSDTAVFGTQERADEARKSAEERDAEE